MLFLKSFPNASGACRLKPKGPDEEGAPSLSPQNASESLEANVSFSQEGTFEGYASVFNAIDHQNDAIAPGAFSESLAKWKAEGHLPKLLWQHDPQTPIGIWDHMEEDDYGLFVRGHLLLNLPKGREAYILLKEGIVDGLSIGFLPRKSHQESKARVIDQVDLFEVSLVTFTANPLAYVTAYKERDGAAAPQSQTPEATFGTTVPLPASSEAPLPRKRAVGARQSPEKTPQQAIAPSYAKGWSEEYRSAVEWGRRLWFLQQSMNGTTRGRAQGGQTYL